MPLHVRIRPRVQRPRRLLPGLRLHRPDRRRGRRSACCAGVAVREERLAWLVMGAGLLAWAGGEITWTLMLANDPNPPYPSVADALYLAFYPGELLRRSCSLARSRTESFRSSLWLDGGDRRADGGGADRHARLPADRRRHRAAPPPQIAVNLAYPVGDLLLLALVVTVFGLNALAARPRLAPARRRPRPDAVADGIYLVQTAKGTYVRGRRCSTPPGPPRRSSWRSRRGSRAQAGSRIARLAA